MDKAKTPGAAIVIRGYARVDGEFPPILLARATGPDGKAIGYRTLEGQDQLNVHQLATFQKLPPMFRFTEAMTIYDRTDNPTNMFLDKLIRLGLVERDKEHGVYVKLAGDTGSLGQISKIESVQQPGFKAA